MASYNELNALIDAYINRNGVQAITGQILNGVLKAMVEQLGRGYTIMGAATPATDPGTPDGPECYFASEVGTYTDFDGLQIVPGELALLCYTPSDGWTKATIYEGFQTVQASIDGNVGTPSVGVSYANGVLSFDFHNMKGNPGQNGQDGQDGDAAGFGTIGADITGGVGTPGVSVESSGPATAKNLQFHFTNLKGETGVTSVVATVDNTTGTPTCTASLSGGVLTLAFTGLKGAQGDTGSSVDYPFTIVNNLTTDDATQALSAAQGVVLQGEITQLEHKVYDFTKTQKIFSLTSLSNDYKKIENLNGEIVQDKLYLGVRYVMEFELAAETTLAIGLYRTASNSTRTQFVISGTFPAGKHCVSFVSTGDDNYLAVRPSTSSVSFIGSIPITIYSTLDLQSVYNTRTELGNRYDSVASAAAAIPGQERFPGRVISFIDSSVHEYIACYTRNEYSQAYWESETYWIVYKPEAVFNANRFNTTVFTLSSAISLIPTMEKMPGKLLTFISSEGVKLYQFRSESYVNDWTNLDNWVEITGGGGPADIPDGSLTPAKMSVPFLWRETSRKLPVGTAISGSWNGTGWTESSGEYTHASGNTDALVFSASTTATKVYLLSFDFDTVVENCIFASVGDGYKADVYNGETHIEIAVLSDGGSIKLTPVSDFTGTISNLVVREVVSSSPDALVTIGPGNNPGSVKMSESLDKYTGFWNITGGIRSLQNNINASRNVSLGHESLRDLQVGTRNIALGTYALSMLKYGERNIAIGADSLWTPYQAIDCIGIGKAALSGLGLTMENCIAIGRNAIGNAHENVSFSVAIGTYSNKVGASKCVSIGEESGPVDKAAIRGVFIGYHAGYGPHNKGEALLLIGTGTTAETDGTNSAVAIGTNSTVSGVNVCAIGHDSHARGNFSTAIGKGATTSGSYAIAIGGNVTAAQGDIVIGSSNNTGAVKIAGKILIFNIDGTMSWTAES